MKIPKIDFPCDYPIKVIGRADPMFDAKVLHVFNQQSAIYDPDRVALKESGKGNYCSITVWIEAQSEQQLQDLFLELKAIDNVTMVL